MTTAQLNDLETIEPPHHGDHGHEHEDGTHNEHHDDHGHDEGDHGHEENQAKEEAAQ